MLTRFLKGAFANLGLAIVITGSIGMLGWWWDVKFNEKMAPIIATISLISNQLSHFEAHQETLRTEVKSNAENKVDKITFRNTIDEMDNRFNAAQIAQDVVNENKDTNNPGGSNEH